MEGPAHSHRHLHSETNEKAPILSGRLRRRPPVIAAVRCAVCGVWCGSCKQSGTVGAPREGAHATLAVWSVECAAPNISKSQPKWAVHTGTHIRILQGWKLAFVFVEPSFTWNLFRSFIRIPIRRETRVSRVRVNREPTCEMRQPHITVNPLL